MATKKETGEKGKKTSQAAGSTKAAKGAKAAKGTKAAKDTSKPSNAEASDKQAPAKKVPAKKASVKEASKPKTPTAAQKKEVTSLIEDLSNASRRHRQEAAHELAEIAQTVPEAFEGKVEDLIDALYRPEAQTRWEILAALASLSGLYGNEVIKAFDGAEASLFDDASSTVRLAAFLFLTCYGSTSQKHSDEAWPLLNEAIQCYHGDAEYYDMLVGVLSFAKGTISKETKKALKERFTFDAENATGYMRKFSAEIVAAAK